MVGLSDGARAGRPTTLRWRKAAMRLGLSVLTLAVLLVVLNEEELYDHVAGFISDAPGAWGAGLLLFMALHAVGALKWRLFLRLSGVHIGKRMALRFYGVGLFANLCLPSLIGGDVLRAGLAMSVVEEKAAVLLGSVVDRLADLLALAAVVTVGGLLAPGALASVKQSSVEGTGSVDGTTLVLGFLGVLAVGVAGAAVVLRPVMLRRVPRRLAPHLGKLLHAARAVRRRPFKALAIFGLCLVVQTGFVAVNVAIGGAMGLELDLRLWLLLWPLAKIAAMMPLSLGGLGVREVAFATLVAPFGISSELAVAQSLVWQSVLIAGGVLAGVLALITRRPQRQSADDDRGR